MAREALHSVKQGRQAARTRQRTAARARHACSPQAGTRTG